VADVRLAELVAALSLATDLGMGQPMEHALRACLLSLRLGEHLGLSEDELVEVYYVALLQRIGCTADAHELASWFPDELAAHAKVFTLDLGSPSAVGVDVLRNAGRGLPLHMRARALGRAFSAGRGGIASMFRASCEVGAQLAGRLGLPGGVRTALTQVFERWDGKGLPGGRAGEDIPRSVRVVQVARDAEVFHRLGGSAAVAAMARERAGRAHDPRVAAALGAGLPAALEAIEDTSAWDAVVGAEPGPRPVLDDDGLDRALSAAADFADLKSAFTVGHSSGVAAVAEEAARRAGIPEARLIRRAALVHDLGRTGIPNAVWEKAGRLSDGEWEQIRLHAYLTERILSRPETLRRLGCVAGLHHERLDGSGYHRGAMSGQLSPSARVLAAADAYHALLESRPHRPALAPGVAATALRVDVKEGRLDGAAVDAVLAAAGHRVRRRREWPAGLSVREVEVLRLISRGHSNREVAARLHISPKTVGHHVQHIYDKIGMSTRAGAACFAMEHGLLDPAESEPQLAAEK
jgi:HD-GYP domain-containing protein (c-di-GMP phosphodiesterase class II)